jgi:hypothetical protein
VDGSRPGTIKHDLRVALLANLVDQGPTPKAQLAQEVGVPPSVADYHLGVLAEADAVVIVDDTATITDEGRALHRRALVPERRSEDRRRGDRRGGPG